MVKHFLKIMIKKGTYCPAKSVDGSCDLRNVLLLP